MYTHTIGHFLKTERELRHVSLEELAQTTRIPIRSLLHIEADELERLPGEVFVRGFVRAYARALGLDADDVLDAHFKERPAESAPAPITALTPPEKARRHGVAFAVVVLLVLFTLALSIVLRPRHRDAPLELSQNACTSLTTTV
jgi:cytoskeletal protein RodZ